jgi:DNA repair exonuclease SbcCD ATPase subunit
MSTGEKAWRLEKIVVTDILGFQGSKEFAFQDGLQVIEASNHTGKSSLTMALLWGLTGVIPNLARINRQSFRLTNKHSGESARPEVVIVLRQADGTRLRIRRAYQARPKPDEDLSVDVDEKTFSGEQGQEEILAKLGLKAETLEGCGVVLQDHRLGLITGKDSDISDVINDLLGLYTLSQLVPTLETAAKEAADLKREVQNYLAAADPLARWEQRATDLQNHFHEAENKAITAGFAAADLEDPRGTGLAELGAAAEALGQPPPATGADIAREVNRLRKALGELRKQHTLSSQLGAVQVRMAQMDGWARTARKLEADLTEEHETLLAEASRGELDAAKMNHDLAEADAVLDRNKSARERLQQERGLLTACYDHLLAHPDAKSCPLCLQPATQEALLPQVKGRIDGQIAGELEALQAQDNLASDQKKALGKRLKVVSKLREEHDKLMRELSVLSRNVASELPGWGPPADGDAVFLDPAARQRLMGGLGQAAAVLEAERAKAGALVEAEKTALAKHEATVFQPTEARMNRVADHLIPILVAANRIEEHGKLRDRAAAEKKELEQVQEEANSLAGQIKRISGALSKHEEDAASAAVRERLPQVSTLFCRIAGNPDYDGLDVQTSLSRERVAYKVRATSSKLGNLNDTVGHVLSEGDLSSAGMALILGLAAGQSGRLGFLVLDDPAQGMDDTLQSNFAAALVENNPGKQIVVLTHQSSFARALRERGANASKWKGWKLGRLEP